MSPVAAEPQVDEKLAAELGLSAEEYARLRGFLGRDPSYTELGITSALWSEHCSYCLLYTSPSPRDS